MAVVASDCFARTRRPCSSLQACQALLSFLPYLPRSQSLRGSGDGPEGAPFSSFLEEAEDSGGCCQLVGGLGRLLRT